MKTRELATAMAMLAVAAGTLVAAGPPEVANVAKNPAEVPPPLARSKVSTVTVNLEAKEVIAEVVAPVLNPDNTVAIPAKKAWVWTFNGTIPGPMVRCMEGDTLVVNVSNPNTGNIEPHNVDFHATMGPGGGAAVTGVEPGQTKTLTFKAMRAGSYIYHCAGEGMPWEHVAYGMYGMIMVEPVGGLTPGYKEFYVGQSDWYWMRNADSVEDHRDFLADDDLVLDRPRADEELPTHYTFNGHLNALTKLKPLMVNQGDKVRIFFVNGGPNKASSFHIIGQIFDKVYTGHPRNWMVNEETVLTPPGSAAVVEMTALVPGTYVLVDHALWRVPKGAGGHLHVMATVPPTVDASGMVTDPGSWPLDLYSPITTGTGH
ncbi:MAG TPA: multicopper oxidase domain-containing protein [Verrucomicrobiae bacterium]